MALSICNSPRTKGRPRPIRRRSRPLRAGRDLPICQLLIYWTRPSTTSEIFKRRPRRSVEPIARNSKRYHYEKTDQNPPSFCPAYVWSAVWPAAAAKSRCPRRRPPRRPCRWLPTRPATDTPRTADRHARADQHPRAHGHADARRHAHPGADPAPVAFLQPSQDDVNTRKGPGTNYGKVGQVTRADTLGVYGKSADGGWYKICCVNGQEAWIASQFAQLSGDIAPSPWSRRRRSTPRPRLTPWRQWPAALAVAGAHRLRLHRQRGAAGGQPAARQILRPVWPAREPPRARGGAAATCSRATPTR